MKTIKEIIKPFYTRIGKEEYFDKPQTIKNNWGFRIENCIVYIEVLGLSGGSEEVIWALRNQGYTVEMIGLDIYVIQSKNQI